MACALCPALAQPTGANLVQTELLSSVDSVAPGQSFEVGVLLKIEPKWHVYWSNPGDSGQATTIGWNVPEGFTVASTQYPIPTNFTQPGDLAGYGYEREVLFTTIVTAPTDLPTVTGVALSADVRWLVCEQVCIPGKAKLDLNLPVGSGSGSKQIELFENAKSMRPVDLAQSTLVSNYKTSFDARTSTAKLTFDTAQPVLAVTFFPGANDAIEIQRVKNESDGLKHSVHVAMKKIDGDGAGTSSLDSLLVVTQVDGHRVGVNVAVPLK
jgi:DsbC/DsbD-like thiol-disulfide interchange protein